MFFSDPEISKGSPRWYLLQSLIDFSVDADELAQWTPNGSEALFELITDRIKLAENWSDGAFDYTPQDIAGFFRSIQDSDYLRKRESDGIEARCQIFVSLLLHIDLVHQLSCEMKSRQVSYVDAHFALRKAEIAVCTHAELHKKRRGSGHWRFVFRFLTPRAAEVSATGIFMCLRHLKSLSLNRSEFFGPVAVKKEMLKPAPNRFVNDWAFLCWAVTGRWHHLVPDPKAEADAVST